MVFDESKYPLTASYHNNLPDGFYSYPQCKTRNDLYTKIRHEFSDIQSDGTLPAEVRQALNKEQDEQWLLESMAGTLLHLVRDIGFTDDDAYLDWIMQLNLEAFQKPLYKVLIKMFSTKLLVMSASKRWSTLHTGSTLQTKPATPHNSLLSVEASLHYPAHLFDELMAKTYAQAFVAAADISQAQQPHVKMVRCEETYAAYQFFWRA